MKYNININQKALADSGLDLKDSAILDYLYVYCNSLNPKVEEQRIDNATWVSYQALMDDMPLLQIKTRQSITPRIQKIEKAGFITTVLKNVNGHTKLFVKLTPKTDTLFVEVLDHVRETKKPVSENKKHVRETLPYNNTNNNNTIDNNTNDNIVQETNYKVLTSNFGSDKLRRVAHFYSKVWFRIYNIPYRINYSYFDKVMKNFLDLTELQICALIIVHFNWKGTSGSDKFVYKRLVDASFPFGWIPNSMNSYIAFLTNSLDIDFEDDKAVYNFVGENIKELST